MLMTVLRRPIANSILVLFTTIISTQMITTPAHSQSGGQPTELADPVAVDMGKQFFARACTYCHGKEGAGGKTPAFKGRKDFTSQYLIDVIENGRVNGSNIMPAWKGSLSPTQLSQLVAYILSLASQPAE
jgi:mono/diheme cytochrome c family protein